LAKLRFFTILSCFLALTVIVLGAYTRLTDAGLGCPDWPGCYGQFSAPDTQETILKANLIYPDAPVDIKKAQTEMTHRYFAESLGFLIIVLSMLIYWQRQQHSIPLWLPFALITLVLFQGLLGMWTVTLKLLPLAVIGHLLGGFSTLSLLWLCWLYSRDLKFSCDKVPNSLKFLAVLSFAVLLAQIFLGGWTSANYAALVCPDFPKCQGHWWPTLQFAHAFNLTGALKLDNPLAFMDTPQLTAIHVTHRFGAMFTALLISALIYRLFQFTRTAVTPTVLKSVTIILTLLLITQLTLGILNVLMSLPLVIAVAHNVVAALLLLSLITLLFILNKVRTV